MLVVDTSVLVGHLRGDAGCRDLLRAALRTGEVRVPTLVEWELWKGAERALERSKVKALLDVFEPALLTPDVARVAAQVHRELSTQGRPLPGIDVLIAAHALQLGCPLAAIDGDFARIPDLFVVGPTG